MRRGLTYFGRRSVGNFPAGSGTNPFFQSGPTLDLNFAGVPTDPLQAATLQDQTLDLNYIVQTYQVAAQYAIWESGVGLASKNFSDIVTFTRASTATYFDSAGVLQSAAVDAARFDYDPSTLALRGLLIEEQRTNSIRNNTMQGAVAGTPGTLPTNWSTFTALTGLTRTIVGTGTENGVTYVDIRVNGTPSAAGIYGIYFEPATQVAALSGQTWTSSSYCKLASGSLAGVTEVRNTIAENNSGGSFLAGSNVPFTPTSAALNTQRFAVTRTLNNASTAFIIPYYDVVLTGAAIDITLRIGLPQLELGAFATSVIPTTTTALTRSADVASVNTLSPWFNSTTGTIYAEASVPVAAAYTGYAYLLGTFNDGIHYYRQLDFQPVDRVRTGSVDQFLNGFGAIWNTTGVFKNAQAYGTNDFAGVVNGGAVATDTSGTVPTVSVLNLGGTGGGSTAFNGYLRRVTYYPRRLANADLQTLTA